MVYIRPSAPVTMPTTVKPVAGSSHEPEQHSLASDTVVNEFLITPAKDRRKQDRRQQRKDALLETRAGRDRRKSNKTTISISV